jgi:heat shock protein HslJ
VVTGNCNSDSATVTITVGNLAIANAGTDKTICDNSLFLEANNPLLISNNSVGTWTKISGGNLTFQNSSIYNTQITNLENGEYFKQLP